MGIQKRQQYCPEHKQLVLAERGTPNRVLHLLLSLVTFGLWVPIWILIELFQSPAFRCPMCGTKTKGSWSKDIIGHKS